MSRRRKENRAADDRDAAQPIDLLLHQRSEIQKDDPIGRPSLLCMRRDHVALRSISFL